MAALVCDLCGGKLVMGAGGITVCDSCGMEYSTDRMKEKIQEVKGVVRVDNSHMIDNYLEMALTAQNANNNAEAESYCNKIIEIDSTNYKAWFLKGKAAGWQSTLEESRVSESIAAFAKAIANAPEEDKEGLGEQAKEQIINLVSAIISLRRQRFAKWPTQEETNGFISDIASILQILMDFILQTGVSIPLSELTNSIAININNAVIEAYENVIFHDYNGTYGDSDDRANKYEWQRYIERIAFCTELLEKAISLREEDDENNIQQYENLILLHERAITSCSWDYEMVESVLAPSGWKKRWYKEYMLSDEAIRVRRNFIRTYEEKIKAIKEVKEKKEKEEKKKRFDDYWATHADEKVALEKERRKLQEQISILQIEISNIPGKTEKENIQERINALSAEMKSLGLLSGLFKGKEKKIIQEKINAANSDLKNVVDRMDVVKKEIEQKIYPLQQRVNKINEELTMSR